MWGMRLRVYVVTVTENTPAIEVMFDISEWDTSYKYDTVVVYFEDGGFSMVCQGRWSNFTNEEEETLKLWTAAIFRLMFPNKTFK